VTRILMHIHAKDTTVPALPDYGPRCATTGFLPGPSAPGCHPEEVRAYRVGELNLGLWHLPNLTTAHTKPTGEPPPWVGACADLTGAAYYALKHNRSSEPELGFRPGNITYMTPRQAASRERNPIPEETKRAIRKALRKGRSVYSIARRYDVGEKRVREMRDER
jgi:hypothetical protein